MTVAGVGLLTALARIMGVRVLRPILTALATGLPVAIAAGLAIRVATTHVTSLSLAVLIAVAGAVAAAGVVLATIHLADRSLLRTVRGARATPTDIGDLADKKKGKA